MDNEHRTMSADYLQLQTELVNDTVYVNPPRNPQEYTHQLTQRVLTEIINYYESTLGGSNTWIKPNPEHTGYLIQFTLNGVTQTETYNPAE